MIANARMYSVNPEVGDLWRRLLGAVIGQAGLDIQLLEHREPAPMQELWQRHDLAAVFMCGLPYSRSTPRPLLIAAPIPSPADFRGLPQYWSELVVRADSAFRTVSDTFGGRLALTVPDSQSGCWAALRYFREIADRLPLYGELIAPQVTPRRALSAVIEGAADVAPIDSYAYALLQRYNSDLTSQLRSIGRTAPTPIPALVATPPSARAASNSDFEALRAAFREAHRMAATAPLLADLLLERFASPDPSSYDALRLNFEAASQYWKQHRLAATVHPGFAAGESFAT
jgi:ABC-type phosphate/phosphonate transport system substrate-binding protein